MNEKLARLTLEIKVDGLAEEYRVVVYLDGCEVFVLPVLEDADAQQTMEDFADFIEAILAEGKRGASDAESK